jgi:hypothetical protein
MDTDIMEKAIQQEFRNAIIAERRECEIVALRVMEQHQGTDAGKVAGEIAAAIRARP